MQRTQKLFLIKFFIVLVGMYLLVAWNPVNDHVIVPATKVIAQGGGLILKALGQQVDVRGTTISGTRFAVNINNGCNGIEAMLILLAAIGSFPATLRARLTGLGIGALIVQILNEIRIVTLYLIGAYKPALFQVFHTAVWQVVVILAAIVFFLQWSARVAPTRLANGA